MALYCGLKSIGGFSGDYNDLTNIPSSEKLYVRITKEEYEALTNEEKNDKTKVYLIMAE